MALIWFDGFESYDVDGDMNKVSSDLISSVVASGMAYVAGRNGRAIGSTWTGNEVRYNFVSTYQTLIVGFAMQKYEAGDPSPHTSYLPFAFRDGTTHQIAFAPNASGELNIYRGTTLIDTTTGLDLTTDEWVFLEFKVTIDNSSGSLEIIKNGSIEIYNDTGMDTQQTGNAYVDNIWFSVIASNKDVKFDDLYVLDTTGSKNNDFLGDIRVDAIRPNAEGTYTEFTPSAGDNFENVDETYGPDEDTTYNSGTNVGDQDTYNLGALEDLGGTTIHGVKSQITVKKSDAGSREVKILTRSGTTDDLGSTITLATGYTTPTKIYEDNPDDAAAWEDSDVNALEVGVEVTV